jgi:hypothetical protein
MKILIYFLASLILVGCKFKKTDKKLNFLQCEELVAAIDAYAFREVGIGPNKILQIDGLSLYRENTKLYNHRKLVDLVFINDSMFCAQNNMSMWELDTIYSKVVNCNCEQLIIENDAYFFITGSWIDASWGEVYSKSALSGMEEKFTFNRIQEIKPNKKRTNWFHFYAD